MKNVLFISALLLFLCVSSFGIAFDNQRRGFIIGGIGGIAGNTWHEQDGTSDTDFAIHTDFRIGGGFKGDKWMLYYWNVANWYNIDDPGGNDLTVNGITMIGASYYLKPTSPSLYFNAGIGASGWSRRWNQSSRDNHTGFGAMGGIGYEFRRHWSVEAGIMWGQSSTSDGKPNFLACTLSIIGIAY